MDEDKLFGNYRAVVTDTADPTKSGRVKIDIPSLRLRNAWAEPALSLGGASGKGSYVIPRVGDKIFIFFDGGNIAHPIYFATSPSQNDIPVAFNGGTDSLIQNRNANSLVTPSWSEPKTNATVTYPYGQGIKFPGGTLMLVDESQGTTIGVYHPTNSYQEMQSSGNHIVRVAGSDYEIIMGSKFMYVGGSISDLITGSRGVTVGRDDTFTVAGSSIETIIGQKTVTIGGSMAVTAAGSIAATAASMALTTAGGTATLDSSGLEMVIATAIKLTSLASMTFTAMDITLKAAQVKLGPVGTVPILVLGTSYCPFIGSPVTGGSATVFGSP